MTTKNIFVTTLLLFLLCCSPQRVDFEKYIEEIPYVKTPLTFKDASSLTNISRQNNPFDSLFLGRGIISVGKIQQTKNTVSLLVIDTNARNEIYIKTFDSFGKVLESYLLNTKWGMIDDSTQTDGLYTIKNQTTLLLTDSVTSISHDNQGNEIITTVFREDTTIIYPNSKLKK